VAGILNAAVRVVHVSWSCLFIEDAPVDLRVRLYTWMSVAGTLSGFFAPLAGFFVDRFGLVPATRGLYGFAFLAMTSMIWIRNAKVKETDIGIQRMREIRGKGKHNFLGGIQSRGYFIFREPKRRHRLFAGPSIEYPPSGSQ